MDGDTEMARLLIEKGADVNSIEKRDNPINGGPNFSPLKLAACEGNEPIVRMLLEHGASRKELPGAIACVQPTLWSIK